MRFSVLKHLRRSSPRTDAAITRDADELMQTWGSAAYSRAADLSWREDSGLVHSPKPGHWLAVRREIGRREGSHDREPVAEFVA